LALPLVRDSPKPKVPSSPLLTDNLTGRYTYRPSGFGLSTISGLERQRITPSGVQFLADNFGPDLTALKRECSVFKYRFLAATHYHVSLPKSTVEPTAETVARDVVQDWVDYARANGHELQVHSFAASLIDRIAPALEARELDDDSALRAKLGELVNASYTELRSSVEINRRYNPCSHENVIDGAKYHYKNYATPEEWAVTERVSGWFQERIAAALADPTASIRALSSEAGGEADNERS